jgi:DNA-3-methyladenine glycosylase II
VPESTFSLQAKGAFSLAESATFGFGQREEPQFDGVMRLAFCLDGGFETQVGVELRQTGAEVQAIVRGAAPDQLCPVEEQVARLLSLDCDATRYDALGERDPVVGELMAAAPGLRPPLFYSPYEAAAWAILSARRPARQMNAVRAHMSAERGRVFELAGQELAAFPTPSSLGAIEAYPGLPAEKISRLHGVADAAKAGCLEVARLVALGPEAAEEDVMSLRGIGPFYSQLIVIRACGFTDVLPVGEHNLLGLVGELYGLGRPASDAELVEIAEAWRPWRTWVSVLIRVAGARTRAR